MAHIQKVGTNQRRNGKPVYHYEVRWTEVVVNADGTRGKRYPQETYKTKADAEERLGEIESERAATGAVTGREARLEPFAVYANAWLRSLDIRVARGALKERTRAEYARIIHTYLLPEFGNTPIGRVGPERIEDFAATLLVGRSPQTFDRIWHVFGRVLKYAVQKKAIPTNPMDSTDLEAGHSTGDAEGFTAHPLSAAEIAGVAEHIGRRYPVYALVTLFAAYTGLRAAELAGLEIGDLDLRPGNPSVRVVRTKRRKGGEWITGTPKSKKSRRTVPLESWLADDLREFVRNHPRSGDPAAPLFPNRRKGGDMRPGPDGSRPPVPLDWDNPVQPGTLYSGPFKTALEDLGIAPTRWHDLRHSFAVLNLTAGVHYMLVSKWLGHATYVTTLNVYADYIPESEGGKSIALDRPTAPAPKAAPADNVVQFRRREA